MMMSNSANNSRIQALRAAIEKDINTSGAYLRRNQVGVAQINTNDAHRCKGNAIETLAELTTQTCQQQGFEEYVPPY